MLKYKITEFKIWHAKNQTQLQWQKEVNIMKSKILQERMQMKKILLDMQAKLEQNLIHPSTVCNT